MENGGYFITILAAGIFLLSIDSRLVEAERSTARSRREA